MRECKREILAHNRLQMWESAFCEVGLLCQVFLRPELEHAVDLQVAVPVLVLTETGTATLLKHEIHEVPSCAVMYFQSMRRQRGEGHLQIPLHLLISRSRWRSSVLSRLEFHLACGFCLWVFWGGSSSVCSYGSRALVCWKLGFILCLSVRKNHKDEKALVRSRSLVRTRPFWFHAHGRWTFRLVCCRARLKVGSTRHISFDLHCFSSLIVAWNSELRACYGQVSGGSGLAESFWGQKIPGDCRNRNAG